MEPKDFTTVLADAFRDAAAEHGQSYPEGGELAWGAVGAAYLGFALCGLQSTVLRRLQYDARQESGPVILDCKWYDALEARCLEGKKSVQVFLPGPDNTACLSTVTRDLFLEMLDFCREG
jgi:hypothetical protein